MGLESIDKQAMRIQESLCSPSGIFDPIKTHILVIKNQENILEQQQIILKSQQDLHDKQLESLNILKDLYQKFTAQI